MKKPKVKMIGTDGNIFALVGRATSALRRAGMPIEAKELQEKVLRCDSYNKALCLIYEYIDEEENEDENEEDYGWYNENLNRSNEDDDDGEAS